MAVHGRRNALIWEVKLPDIAHSSYVMGTMHVQDARAFSKLEQADALMTNCSAFYSEVNLTELMENAQSDWTLLPDGLKLTQVLGRKYGKVRRLVKKSFGLDISHYERFLPMVVVQLITEHILQKDHPVALDFELWQRAESAGLEMGGIESTQEHFSVMERIPIEVQKSMLLRVTRDVHKFRVNVTGLCELYAQGRIHELFRRSIKSLGGLKQIMLYDRNQLMANRMHDFHRKGPTFLAVGAAHLSGKKGLIHLLSTSGCKMKPLI